MKKILITGARGFIGRNLTESLSGEYLVFSPNSDELNLLNEEVTCAYLEQHNFDIVVHSAKRDGVREGITLSDYEVLDSNLRMFYNLEKNSASFGKMIYFGSGAEYDRSVMQPKTKEMEFGVSIPRDSYGFAKYIMSRTTEHSENIVDLRLFGVFGKYEAWDRRFISNAIFTALTEKKITISKNVYFDYLYINDLANIVRWFIENDSLYKQYNICTGKSIDLYTLAQYVRESIDDNIKIEIKDEGLKPEYSGDNTRMKNEIDYYFTDYREAINNLVEFYKGILSNNL